MDGKAMAGINLKHELIKIARSIKITEYLSGMDYLKALFQKMKEQWPNYTHHDFSAGLGFARANNMIRLIVSGKRNLSPKQATKIANALDLHGTERRYWTAMAQYNAARTVSEREALFRLMVNYKSQSQPSELDADQVRYFSEWFHPVIREILPLAGIDGDPEAIKARLAFPLRLDEIKDSLKLLENMGAIVRDPETSRYRRTEARIATDSEVDSLAIVRFHQKMIEIGRESITRVQEDLRSINAVTVSIPRSAVPIIKGKIQELVAAVMALEDGGSAAEDVYQMNIQLFPFTK